MTNVDFSATSDENHAFLLQQQPSHITTKSLTHWYISESVIWPCFCSSITRWNEFETIPMLIFIWLTMMMGGVVLLSASLFYLNDSQPVVQHLGDAQRRVNGVVFDDVELPALNSPARKPVSQQASDLLEFTRTSCKRSNQIPLLGLPDKSFYHIH